LFKLLSKLQVGNFHHRIIMLISHTPIWFC
jgi:hypothetical protein